MALQAKYDGYCRRCGHEIEVGDLIEVNRAEGVIHADCPNAGIDEELNVFDDPRKKPADICPSCFLEKPCPCEDNQ